MIERGSTMWSNSTLLKGAATETVATLDEQPAGNLLAAVEAGTR
jgi:hypothetical protein